MRRSVLVGVATALLLGANTGCITAIAAFQPETDGTIVITTTDAEGEPHDRVLTPIDDEGTLFVSANHWPRAWYRRALAQPDVQVTRGGETTAYTAVPVDEEERERLLDLPGFPWIAYVLTGFAPREFLRFDPTDPPTPGYTPDSGP